MPAARLAADERFVLVHALDLDEVAAVVEDPPAVEAREARDLFGCCVIGVRPGSLGSSP